MENVLIYTLFRDSKGRIWIGTEESLFLYAGGKLEELHLSSSAYLHGLIQAFCVQEDSRHEIWIGSSTGLYCYKEGAPTAWKHYTMKDGLPNDFIYNILEDERGRLWLTTNTVSYTHLNNKLWVGTIDGLNWYEGSRFVSYYKAPDDTTSLANNHVYSLDRKSTRLNSSHIQKSRMPSSA